MGEEGEKFSCFPSFRLKFPTGTYQGLGMRLMMDAADYHIYDKTYGARKSLKSRTLLISGVLRNIPMHRNQTLGKVEFFRGSGSRGYMHIGLEVSQQNTVHV